MSCESIGGWQRRRAYQPRASLPARSAGLSAALLVGPGGVWFIATKSLLASVASDFHSVLAGLVRRRCA